MREQVSLLLVCFLFLSSHAFSAVVLNSTRYIYKSTDKEISVRLSNVGDTPALMQLWIDLGDTSANPNEIEAPFIISPPLIRINARQNQTVRMVYVGDQISQTQETLFWLNALEVPPKPTEQDAQNYLQFSVRTRVKLFYRPSSLKGGVTQAVSQVKVKVLKTAPFEIQIENPTPFYVSFSEIWLKSKGERKGDGLFGMVSPYGSLEMKFKPITASEKEKLTIDEIELNALDEFGANIPLSVEVK